MTNEHKRFPWWPLEIRLERTDQGAYLTIFSAPSLSAVFPRLHDTSNDVDPYTPQNKTELNISN